MTDRSQHPARRPRARALAALATGLVALTGCTATDDPPAAAPTSPSATATPAGQSASASVPAAEITPTPRPSTFAGAAGITFPDANVFDGAAADSTVLTMNGQSLVGRSLPTLETVYTLAPEGGSYADLWVDEQEETGVLLSTLSADGAGTRAGSDAYGSRSSTSSRARCCARPRSRSARTPPVPHEPPPPGSPEWQVTSWLSRPGCPTPTPGLRCTRWTSTPGRWHGPNEERARSR